MNIEDLASAFEIDIMFWDCQTFLITEGGLTCIIDIKKEPTVQYEEFLHELAHVIYMADYESLRDINHWKYLETKVNTIVPYVAIPKFALPEMSKCDSIYHVAEKFNISVNLAWRRYYKLNYKGVGRIEKGCIVRTSLNRAADR